MLAARRPLCYAVGTMSIGRFLGQRKKYWLVPLVVVVVVFGLLLLVAQKSGTGPFHYTF